MKRSSNWDEKLIENQLRKLPKIEDKQSKEALFERIQEKLQEEKLQELNKKKNWFVPSIAVAAVFFLMLLLVPSFLNERDVTIEDSHNEELKMEEAEDVAFDEAAGINSIEKAPGIAAVPNDLEPIYLGAVQPADAKEFSSDLINIAIPVYGPGGEFAIPVTVFSNGQSELERFLTAKDAFSGEAWGIGKFPSIEINSMSESKDGVLVIDVPKGSLENLSSAESFIYSQALQETFSQKYEKIEFSSDGEPGVFWGQTGPISEMDLTEPNRGYYLFESYTGHLFLVRGKAINAPGNNVGDELSLQETLQAMKQGDMNIGYRSAIPEEIIITNVTEEDNIATVTFADGTYLENSQVHLAMVEAILFTARDFGNKYVRLNGIEQTEIGPYVMGDLIEIPQYVNFIR